MCPFIVIRSYDKRVVVCGAVRVECFPPFRIYGKRFLLGGAEDFSRHLYTHTGSRICPDSYPGVLPLRIKHVNHEAARYAEIWNVLHFTSTRHSVMVARRTSVGLPL